MLLGSPWHGRHRRARLVATRNARRCSSTSWERSASATVGTARDIQPRGSVRSIRWCRGGSSPDSAPLAPHLPDELAAKHASIPCGFQIAEDVRSDENGTKRLVDGVRFRRPSESSPRAPQERLVEIVTLSLDRHSYAYITNAGIYLPLRVAHATTRSRCRARSVVDVKACRRERRRVRRSRRTIRCYGVMVGVGVGVSAGASGSVMGCESLAGAD